MIDFRKDSAVLSHAAQVINKSGLGTVKPVTFLGAHLSQGLKWKHHGVFIILKSVSISYQGCKT